MESLEVQVREEEPRDASLIRAVTEQAFLASDLGYHGEADLIDQLRATCKEIVSLVAVANDRVAGHILFSPVELEPASELREGGMAIGPMAVLPEYQHQGIGGRLVQEGLAKLRSTSCPFCVVLGHPRFYNQFGFLPAAEHGMSCEFEGIPAEVFRVVLLHDSCPPDLTGLVRYRREFHGMA